MLVTGEQRGAASPLSEAFLLRPACPCSSAGYQSVVNLWPGAAAETRWWNPANGIASHQVPRASCRCVNMSGATRETGVWTDALVCWKLWNPVFSRPLCLIVMWWICKLGGVLHLILCVRSFSRVSPSLTKWALNQIPWKCVVFSKLSKKFGHGRSFVSLGCLGC